ncbi:MAG: hypothetical protein K2P51_02225 [Rhabdochlamydiaceae bacterium]|nr:hypothetical protein [Rhabdochlamydiaceae bacterium]
MLTIKLNRKEYNYLCQASFLGDQCRKLLYSSEQQDDKYALKISEGQADEFRDLCSEQLQIAGFDEKYELTPEGEILECLVDKFFIG